MQLFIVAGKLQQLVTIDVSYNELTEIPEEIGNCKLVTFLDLLHNKLTRLPESLGKLLLFGVCVLLLLNI